MIIAQSITYSTTYSTGIQLKKMITQRANLKRVAFIGTPKAWNRFVLEKMRESQYVASSSKLIYEDKEVKWIRSEEQVYGMEFDEVIVYESVEPDKKKLKNLAEFARMRVRR